MSLPPSQIPPLSSVSPNAPPEEEDEYAAAIATQNNDGSIELNANINPTSRSCWDAIVTEFSALTGGKQLWFEFVLPGDTDGFFVRGEPLPMRFPDVEAGSAVQGAIQIVENQCDGFQTKIVT